MQCLPEQLPRYCQGSLAPHYLLFGNDPWQRQIALQHLRQAYQAQGFTEILRFEIDSAFNSTPFMVALASLSLFSKKRVFECFIALKKLTAAEQTELLAALKKAELQHPATVFIIVFSELEAKDAKSAWLQPLLKAVHLHIPLHAAKGKRYESLLQLMVGAHGLRATPEALAFFSECCKDNLAAAHQELAKLSLRYPRETLLDFSTLQENITTNSQAEIFTLLDALFNRQTKRVKYCIEQLQQQDPSPILLVWWLAREFELIAQCAYRLQQRETLSQAFTQLRIPVWQQQRLENGLRFLSLLGVWEILLELGQIDQEIKVAYSSQVWIRITHLVLNILRRDESP